MKKLSILVCCHKKSELVKTEEPYLPMQVGAALNPNDDFGYQKDNEGDNISEKNRRYNELTALYWGWKNIKDVEYAGLAHYRRYFKFNLTEKNVDKIFKKKDIIVNRLILNCRVEDHIQALITMEDFSIFLDTMLTMHPEYEQAIIDYTWNNNQWINCTMFVARKEIYDRFCETFFPVFFETEKRIKQHEYSRLNRTFGYLGEYSLGLFVEHEKLRKKYVKMELLPKGRRKGLYFDLGIRPWFKDIRTRFAFWIANERMNSLCPYDSVTNALNSDGIKVSHYDKNIK